MNQILPSSTSAWAFSNTSDILICIYVVVIYRTLSSLKVWKGGWCLKDIFISSGCINFTEDRLTLKCILPFPDRCQSEEAEHKYLQSFCEAICKTAGLVWHFLLSPYLRSITTRVPKSHILLVCPCTRTSE